MAYGIRITSKNVYYYDFISPLMKDIDGAQSRLEEYARALCREGGPILKGEILELEDEVCNVIQEYEITYLNFKFNMKEKLTQR